MIPSTVAELPYCQDSTVLAESLADKDWFVFLDSGFPKSSRARYDIIAAEPSKVLITLGQTTEIRTANATKTSQDNPFRILKKELGAIRPGVRDLPFYGGAIGYFSYDLARRLERLPSIAKGLENIPDMAIGIYEWSVVVDHQQQQSWLVYSGEHPLSESRRRELIGRFSHPDNRSKPSKAEFNVLSDIVSNLPKPLYKQAFKRIKRYIFEGDCYQVNLAQRFSAQCRGNPWAAYLILRHHNAAPFSAYLDFTDVQILSSSPERFLEVREGQVETKPIKGTRPKKADPIENQLEMDALENSVKDRAENLMIVDLLRNDISKSCRLGSVNVPKLFDLESFATVHHLVSTVRGELNIDKDAIDLLQDCFPGGSITGAPKIRSMEIIEELEPNRRGVYCGSIGYIGFNGNMDTNIAIRTMVHSENSIRFWAGGGIVADSVDEQEYQECFDKGAAMIRVLEEMRDDTANRHVDR